MKRLGVVLVMLVALAIGMQPAVALGSIQCQQIPQFCCGANGCDVCSYCTFCRIINVDGSDGGFVTDC